MTLPNLLLASTSPRRRALMGRLGWPCRFTSADLDESPLPGEPPAEYVRRLAHSKALAAAAQALPAEIVLAADTTVADGSQILGKPRHAAEARDMLLQLRGRTHQVLTAIAMLDPHRAVLEMDLCISSVPMRNYSDEEITAYIASGDPLDKAGAYAIQNGVFRPVAAFSGCYACVVGGLAGRAYRLMAAEGDTLMKFRTWLLILLLTLVMAACTGPTALPATQTLLPAATKTLPSPDVSVTRTPDVRNTVETYLQAWQVEDYPTMYALLSRLTLDAITQEDFTRSYTDVANALALAEIKYEILTLLTNPGDAQANCRVTLTSALMGDFVRDILMKFSLENGEWRLQWDETMIMPELREGRSLVVNYTIPARGNIYDRDGKTLVAQADAYALGIVPGQIAEGMEARLLDEVSDLTGKTPEQIKALYENSGADWYVPVGQASAQAVNSNLDLLISLGGLAMTPFSGRYYFDGGVGPHVVGYGPARPDALRPGC